MKSKFTTAVLFIMLLIVLIGIIVFGGMMYIDLMGNQSNQLTYKIDNIATEELDENTNKNLEGSSQSIRESTQGTLSSNLQEPQTVIASSNEKEINNFFYNQLINNPKIIYDKLNDNKQKLKQGNYVINFGDTFSDLLSEEDGSEKLGKDYQTAIEAFIHDNPDLFYLDVNKMYLNIETTTKFLKTTYNVYISPAQGTTYLSDEFSSTIQIEKAIEEIEMVKNNIINSLSGTDYKKILSIHDYLINNIEYDSNYQALGSYNIYGALIGKKCVCEGYAKAFKYLANAAGIECEMMQGTATNSSGQTESHAWNCVKINGVWYEVDATWDDPIIIGNGGRISNDIKYKYFLKGTDTFEKDHTLEYQFSEGGKVFSYPTISKSDY